MPVGFGACLCTFSFYVGRDVVYHAESSCISLLYVLIVFVCLFVSLFLVCWGGVGCGTACVLVYNLCRSVLLFVYTLCASGAIPAA